jgi:ATP-dependent Zn protease
VDEAERLAEQVLSASRESLDMVAQALLERETLTLEEVEQIAGPPPRPGRSGRARAAR